MQAPGEYKYTKVKRKQEHTSIQNSNLHSDVNDGTVVLTLAVYLSFIRNFQRTLLIQSHIRTVRTKYLKKKKQEKGNFLENFNLLLGKNSIPYQSMQ